MPWTTVTRSAAAVAVVYRCTMSKQSGDAGLPPCREQEASLNQVANVQSLVDVARHVIGCHVTH